MTPRYISIPTDVELHCVADEILKIPLNIIKGFFDILVKVYDTVHLK